jgi:elongator complex protein 2
MTHEIDMMLQCSLDETTRLFGPWNRADPDNRTAQLNTWHELSRPQIHGYGVVCLAMAVSTKRPATHQYQFVSGSEEKIFRLFDAPQAFLHNFQAITGISLDIDASQHQMLGANVPSLGLSNKPVFVSAGASSAAPDVAEAEWASLTSDMSDVCATP